MDFIVQCVLFFYFFITDTHQSIDLQRYPIRRSGDTCAAQFSTIEPSFKRAEHCKHLNLYFVNFTETSQELFENLADGLSSLDVSVSNAAAIYVPHNLTSLRVTGTPGYTTQLIIEENNDSYRLEHIALTELPELPANINNLQSLKGLKLISVYGKSVDFNVLSNLTQLETIFIYASSGVTIRDILQLPSLRIVHIADTPVTFLNDSSCRFPNLGSLKLWTNGLSEIPAHFSEFTNVTNFSVKNNRIRHITLDIFANMNQLAGLDLSENQIAELTTQNSLELPLLRRLYLNNNNLSELNATLWVMPALEYLSLRNNQLKQVEGLPMLFTGNVHKYTVELAINPWDCEWLEEIAVQQIRTSKPVGCWKE